MVERKDLGRMINKENKMTDDKDTSAQNHHGSRRLRNGGTSGAVYGMAFFGALIYFAQHATSFWGVVLGILKAIVWPALLIYNLLEFLRM
jgi:hypothetical protein